MPHFLIGSSHTIHRPREEIAARRGENGAFENSAISIADTLLTLPARRHRAPVLKLYGIQDKRHFEYFRNADFHPPKATDSFEPCPREVAQASFALRLRLPRGDSLVWLESPTERSSTEPVVPFFVFVHPKTGACIFCRSGIADTDRAPALLSCKHGLSCVTTLTSSNQALLPLVVSTLLWRCLLEKGSP